MKIEHTLRKEGIQVIKPLDTLKVISIAEKISYRLCQVFPEHILDKTEIFAMISRLNMYAAKLDDKLCGAKYFFDNDSVYFNAEFDLNNIEDFITHECIHYLQQKLDSNGHVSHLGLYDLTSGVGEAINEASVQLMVADAFDYKKDTVKYYDITTPTISPYYYPLQCALLSQMVYFTGTYPLINSTLFSNDIFKNTFSTISDSKTYEFISEKLDVLLNLENELSNNISEIEELDGNVTRIRRINKKIDFLKKEISKTFFTIQNRIISHCFSNSFHNIRNLENLKEFKNKLYEFKNLVGSNSTYTFFNDFYCHTMSALEQKQEELSTKASDIPDIISTSLTIVNTNKSVFSLFRRLFTKLSFRRQRNLL